MENRFDIQYLQLDTSLMDQTDEELKCKPTFEMVTEKGKNDDGSLNKNGILQMYLLNLKCFPYDQKDVVICERISPSKIFKCPERSKMIEKLAGSLGFYDSTCAIMPRPISPVFQGQTLEIRENIQDAIHSCAGIIGMLYDVIEAFNALSEQSIKRVRKSINEVNEIADQIKLDKIHDKDECPRVMKEHLNWLLMQFYRCLKNMLSVDEDLSKPSNEDIYYISAVIANKFSIHDGNDKQTIANTIRKSLQRHTNKYGLNL